MMDAIVAWEEDGCLGQLLGFVLEIGVQEGLERNGLALGRTLTPQGVSVAWATLHERLEQLSGWRRGRPSLASVQLHQARGGFWMARDTSDPPVFWLGRLFDEGEPDVVVARPAVPMRTRLELWRPVSPDGQPRPWPVAP